MSVTYWISPSGMMHKSKGFGYVTMCGRAMKPLSLHPPKWRRALAFQENDFMFPRRKQCETGK